MKHVYEIIYPLAEVTGVKVADYVAQYNTDNQYTFNCIDS